MWTFTLPIKHYATSQLTLKVQITTGADHNLDFSFFSEKRSLDILCESSAKSSR